MRTTVIPAQITTVEDKIAGNLNLTQILILMVPIFWTTIVYTLCAPSMHLAWYKIPLVLVVLFVCLVLSLRIKGRVFIEWLFVLFNFAFRPKYYLFNKNDSYLRTLDLPVFEKKPVKLFKLKIAKKEAKQTTSNWSIADLVRLERLIASSKYSLSFKSGKKGGVNVAFREVKK
jgi:hypothetical protein